MTKQEAYEFLRTMAKGIAVMFGNDCETVVQELVDGQFQMVAIYNGHVSNRKVKSTQGILGGTLDVKELDYDLMLKGVYNQLVVHPSGKKIKSSSFPLKGDDYFYILGINYDITLIEKSHAMFTSLLSFEGDLMTTINKTKENSLASIYEDALATYNQVPLGTHKTQRLEFVRVLHDRHFFEIQKSVPYLSEKLGVSKYTIYKYIKEIEEH